MSYDSSKCDPNLGLKIYKHLIDVGVQTPTIEENLFHDVNKNYESIIEIKINNIQNNVTDIMNELGLSLEDDSLSDTPKRIAKIMINN